VRNSDVSELRKKWEDEMKAAMAENDRQLQEMRQTYEEKLKEKARLEAEAEKNELDQGVTGNQIAEEQEEAKRHNPYLCNLNFDEQLSGKIVHIVREDVNLLGKSSDCNVMLYGPGIQDTHAKLYRKGAAVVLERASDEARILLNGDMVNTKVYLNHHDRLLFGSTQLYVFVNPIQDKRPNMSFAEVTFELAQEEIATKAGFEFHQTENQSIEAALLNKDLLEILPNIELANAISEELNKNVRFEILLISPHIHGKVSRSSEMSARTDSRSTEVNGLERTQVFVKVYNLNNNLEFEWPREKFLNRLYIMKEMYQNYEQGDGTDDEGDVPIDKDPFYDEPTLDQLIGVAHLFLQPLAFMVELSEQVEIIDYRGNEVGIINVDINPCDANRRLFNELDDNFVDSPSELIGRAIHFIVCLHGCRGLPPRFTVRKRPDHLLLFTRELTFPFRLVSKDIYVKFKMFLDSEFSQTSVISKPINPDFEYDKMFSFVPVTRQLVDYLKDDCLVLYVYGRQINRNSNTGGFCLVVQSRPFQ
jgi:kinesin family protein 1